MHRSVIGAGRLAWAASICAALLGCATEAPPPVSSPPPPPVSAPKQGAPSRRRPLEYIVQGSPKEAYRSTLERAARWALGSRASLSAPPASPGDFLFLTGTYRKEGMNRVTPVCRSIRSPIHVCHDEIGLDCQVTHPARKAVFCTAAWLDVVGGLLCPSPSRGLETALCEQRLHYVAKAVFLHERDHLERAKPANHDNLMVCDYYFGSLSDRSEWGQELAADRKGLATIEDLARTKPRGDVILSTLARDLTTVAADLENRYPVPDWLHSTHPPWADRVLEVYDTYHLPCPEGPLREHRALFEKAIRFCREAGYELPARLASPHCQSSPAPHK